MKTLSARERKLLAIALALAAIALVWLALVQPLLDGFTQRAERREFLSRQYAQNERLISRMSSLRRAAETQRKAGAAYAITAPGASEAGEALRTRLADSLATAGGELRAAEAGEASPGWVRASATGVMSYAQLLGWLDRLANEPPYLVVEGLNINADRALQSNSIDLMDVQLETSIPFVPAKPR